MIPLTLPSPFGRPMVPHRNESRGEARSKRDIGKEDTFGNLLIKSKMTRMKNICVVIKSLTFQ